MSNFNINQIPEQRGNYEREVAKQLLSLQSKYKFDFNYESERIPYVITHYYKPDFILTTVSGKKFYIESKGWWEQSDRRKILEIVETNPDIDLRMLFQKDNKIYKGSKTTYSMWCEHYGIRWAVNSIPEEWLSE